jgi:peptide/nickel transport system permease protein
LNKAIVAIFKRIITGLLSGLAVISLIALIIYHAPIDPVRIQFGQRSDPAAIAFLQKKYYLDRPYMEQLFRYFEDISPLQWINKEDLRLEDYNYFTTVTLNNNLVILKWPYLRRSFTTGEKVSALIGTAFPSTLILAVAAMFIALLFGLILGTIAAIKYGSWIDYSITAVTTIFYAVPSYISAILFALVFGFYLHAYTGLPVQGSLYSLDDFGNEYFKLSRLILPSIALGLRPVAMVAQMTRASLLEIFSKEYVRTALSFGLEYARVLRKHIFPNAMNPIITTVSGWFASLLTGAFFVEFVFNYRGLGDLTIQALSQFDLPVILGSCIVTVSIFIVVNIAADIAQVIMDPRIRI